MPNRLADDFDRIMNQATDSFREVAVSLQNDIVDGSPVDKGRFKGAWDITEMNPQAFTFTMENKLDYANKLWAGDHSQKGWGKAGGIPIVLRHEELLKEKFRNIK